MFAYNPPRRVEFRQGLVAEAGEGVTPAEAGFSTIRGLGVLALLGVVLGMVMAPAVLAGVSMLDSQLINQAAGWFRWKIELVPYLDLGRLGSTLALAGTVSRAREDV